MGSAPLLAVRGLAVSFQRDRDGPVSRALRGVDLSVGESEIHGLVGESGCGKTVTSTAIMGLLPAPPARIEGGSIVFEGRDLLGLSAEERRRVRGRQIAMVFQEPARYLNPSFRVGSQITEMLGLHLGMNRREAEDRAAELAGLVGLGGARRALRAYPHELSGGMKQRAMIAMAISCNPRMLIADEPTTALDVTIQAQILDLISRLKQEFGMSVLLITHDLGVVAEICRHVAVMYAGKVVERAGVDELFGRPAHPYTVGLFNSLPRIGGRAGGLKPIPGVVPSLANLPHGCAFQDRCFRRREACGEEPPWREIAPGHHARCWEPLEVGHGPADPGR